MVGAQAPVRICGWRQTTRNPPTALSIRFVCSCCSPARASLHGSAMPPTCFAAYHQRINHEDALLKCSCRKPKVGSNRPYTPHPSSKMPFRSLSLPVCSRAMGLCLSMKPPKKEPAKKRRRPMPLKLADPKKLVQRRPPTPYPRGFKPRRLVSVDSRLLEETPITPFSLRCTKKRVVAVKG